LPEWLVDLFARYGYAVVFAGVFLENTGLPVPGETALLAGAALAHFGRLSLWHVVVTAIAAAILGDNLGFFIGRRGGRWLLERYGHRLGVTAARLAEFDRFFERYGPKTIFVARFITGLRVVGAMLAGASGLRWPIFLFYNASGAVVWCTAVAAAGYMLANSWDTLERWIGRTGLMALILIIIVALFARRRSRSRPFTNSPTH
jgi:membrane protein DedA with SNARE-associated domain